MTEDNSKKIMAFLDLRAAWCCANCRYFIQQGDNPEEGECHAEPPVPMTIEAMLFKGKVAPSPLSCEMVDSWKVVPQIVWMFRRTGKKMTGCGKFQVRKKVN